MLANALATSDSRFYRGDRGVVRALSRDRHLVCAYRIIINKRITLTSSVSKRQSFADDTTAAKLGSTRDIHRYRLRFRRETSGGSGVGCSSAAINMHSYACQISVAV
jgi:hypothetical protein